MKKGEIFRRYVVFSVALFIIALGVTFITRSYLGTSPISSLPYVMSLNTPLSMGTYLFLLSIFLLCVQMIMLGKKGIKKRKYDLLLQFPVSVIFGLFVDLTMYLTAFHEPLLYYEKILTLLVGCFTLALGIALEVVADVTMVSAEYTVQIASKRFKKEFGTIKMALDILLVSIATLVSWLLAGNINGVREGTVIAAFIVGLFVRAIMPYLKFIRHWQTFGESSAATAELITPNSAVVITISREYGSGGHIIGKQLAKKLGLPFYDKELIELVAKEGNFSEKLVSEKEQHMPNRLLYQMIMQDYGAPLEKSLSTNDALFVAQSTVLRRIAKKGDCVIVGRCADYILDDFPNTINIFLHADIEHKTKRVVGEYGIAEKDAISEITRINKARAAHYRYYTDKDWGDARNYNFTFNTATISIPDIINIISAAYKRNH